MYRNRIKCVKKVESNVFKDKKTVKKQYIKIKNTF